MELSKRMLLPAAMTLLFLLVASEIGTTMVEGRLCESQSHRFVGPCVRQANCASVCHTEGFHGGVCRGHVFHRKCYCTRPC